MQNLIDLKAEDLRGYEVVDLRALKRNMEALRASLPEKMNIFGVVKADSYGLGATRVSKTVEELVYGFAVATFTEGKKLRKEGIEKPIIILGPIEDALYEECVELDIQPVLFTFEMAKAFSEAASKVGKTGLYQIAVDSGMMRIGLTPDKDGAELVSRMVSLPGISANGIFSHLATMDSENLALSMEQKEKFISFVKVLRAIGIIFPLVHLANSLASSTEGAFADETLINGCRYGICLYGEYPSEFRERLQISVEPVVSLYSRVTYVKDAPQGAKVGYGATYECTKKTRIATISFGYADGYPRTLSNKAEVLIRGKRFPIIGRVCMDQFMVDVTGCPEIQAGDVVTLLGRDGNEEITLDELEGYSGRLSYEILCMISQRVTRYYLE